VGDAHPNGKWVWTQLPSGKYDWRNAAKTDKRQPIVDELNGKKPAEDKSTAPEPAKKDNAAPKIKKENGYLTDEFKAYLLENKEKIWVGTDFKKYTNVKVQQIGSASANYIRASGINSAGVPVAIVDSYLDGSGAGGNHPVFANKNIKEIVDNYGKVDKSVTAAKAPKFNWRENEVTSIGAMPLPKKDQYTEYSARLGNISLSINSMNLRLKAFIGNKMTFLGGENSQGYFDSIDEAGKWVAEHSEELKAVKTMGKLIYIK